MSIFFDLSSPLRERWWSAISLDEREQIEEEFRESKSLEVPEPYRSDYKKMLTVMDTTFWSSLKDGLCGDKKEQVNEAMKAYLDVSAESNRLEDELYDFNEAWNMSCTPNTDDEKVGKHCEEKCRYENDLHYIQIQEAVLYDELMTLIGL
jgi:hypothetical protein